jgi:hypothetical protein
MKFTWLMGECNLSVHIFDNLLTKEISEELREKRELDEELERTSMKARKHGSRAAHETILRNLRLGRKP